MASRNRLRQLVTNKLVPQFRDWELPRNIDYKSYCSIVDKPVTPMEIKKSYYNWKIAVMSVANVAPEIFKKKPAPEPKAAPKADPLEKLSQAAKAEVKSKDK